MRSLVTTLLVLLLTFAAAAGAPVASAHAVRLSTDPVADAALTSGPATVSATFDERLQTTFSAMTVVGPDGNLWSTGSPRVQGAVLGTDVMPLGPTGVYTANYRVTSADGHVVSGSWAFRLTVAGTGRPGPSAASASGPPQGVPVWPFLIGAALVIAAGAWWTLRRPRRQRRR